MKIDHRASIYALVAIAGIISLGFVFYGSPQTGLTSGTANYLSQAVNNGEEVAMKAAETCYPKRQSYTRYDICCADPCTNECEAVGSQDVRTCQMVCQKTCVKIVTSIYLKRRPGFIGKSSTTNANQQYVVYNQ